MKIYTSYGVAYIKDMDVVNWMMNEIISRCLIFEFMESNNIGIWSLIIYLRFIFEFMKCEICGSNDIELRSKVLPIVMLWRKSIRVERGIGKPKRP